MSDIAESFELFVALISRLLSGMMIPSAFKEEYMHLWRQCRDSGQLSELNSTTNEAFDRIFTAADSYCEDASLRDPGDLDEQQFIDEVAAIQTDINSKPRGQV